MSVTKTAKCESDNLEIIVVMLCSRSQAAFLIHREITELIDVSALLDLIRVGIRK